MTDLKTEASVVSNVAPKHYGVAAVAINPDAKDMGEPLVTFERSGKRGVDKMTWYIHQGDDLMRARPIEFDFFKEYSENPSHSELQEEHVLLECDNAQAPRYPREGHLSPNCTLRTDLSVIPKDFFEKRVRRDSDGNVIIWCELSYKLVVTIQSGPMLFSISCRGKRYGAVTTNY